MKNKGRISQNKKMNPTYFIFCEGKSEEAYIGYLRSKYRLPLIIDSKISGNRISDSYIRNYKKENGTYPGDKTYLIYDLDVPEMLSKLKALHDTVLLCSNPCFELWYLLHFKEQKAAITTNECNTKLLKQNDKYKKGVLDKLLTQQLNDHQEKACRRSCKMKEFENPSTQLYILINDLENLKSILNK
jgi:hypothetical protein